MKTKIYTVEGQEVFISTEPEFPKEAEQMLQKQLASIATLPQVTTVEGGRIKIPRHVANVLLDLNNMKAFQFHLRTAYSTHQRFVKEKLDEESAFAQRLQRIDQEAEKDPIT